MTKRPERKEFETKQQWMKEIQKGLFFSYCYRQYLLLQLTKLGEYIYNSYTVFTTDWDRVEGLC